MAKTFKPPMVQTYPLAYVNLVGANATKTAPIKDGALSNCVLLTTGTAEGKKISKIHFKASDTIVDCIGLIFIGNGTTALAAPLVYEVTIPAATSSVSLKTGEGTIYFDDFILPSNAEIYVGVTAVPAAGSVSVFAENADY